MIRTAEVVIVGGGVMGGSTAYYLARRGVRPVIILERDQLASGSTSLSAGGIRYQFSSETNVRIMLESVPVFERFAEEFDTEIDFRQDGYLFLATTAETWADFQANVALQRRLGVPTRLLSPDDIRELAPYLYLDDVIGGTFCPKDGYADPYSVAMGFARKARELGALISEKTEVTGVSMEGGRVTGVETPKGRIATPVVVNVAGAWSAQVGRMVGVDLPVKPYRRQIFVTHPFDALPQRIPMIIDFEPSFYFRREGPGILMGMTDKDEPSSFNTNVDWDFLAQVVEKAVHRAPLLERAGFMRGWGGLYAVTPDDNPIIGKDVGGVEGFYCAVGFSGHGFMQSPAVGRILADLITTGDAGLDLSEFRLERFARGEGVGEKRVI
ncbi:MAG: FAD-binding oxidoreductase [Chloroflexi bacterium]|nr:FAD-binding oxidoreductase [Anaerolineae bacterium]RLC73564.1 MAG: FAD-binding oxidoreductase [Chloroflexota bacterium]